MGQKTHPKGFRVGVIRPWDSTWYARFKDYAGNAVLNSSSVVCGIKFFNNACGGIVADISNGIACFFASGNNIEVINEVSIVKGYVTGRNRAGSVVLRSVVSKEEMVIPRIACITVVARTSCSSEINVFKGKTVALCIEIPCGAVHTEVDDVKILEYGRARDVHVSRTIAVVG